MAQSLPLPDGTSVTIREGETPEDTWQRAIQQYPEAFQSKVKEEKKEPTIGGQAKEFLKGAVPGGIGFLETAGTGISALLPQEQELATRRAIKEYATAARKPFEAAPGYEETVGRKLGEGFGSFLPLVPLMAAGPLGIAGAGALSVGAGAGEARIKAEQANATPEQISQATALGIIPGALDLFTPARILGRMAEPIKAGAVAMVKRALIAGGEEAAQEAAQQVAQNLIAKGIYKPDQAILAEVGESAAYGGAVGAMVQGFMDLALGRKARTTPVIPQATVGQPPTAGQPPSIPPAGGEVAIPEPTLKTAEEAARLAEAIKPPSKKELAKIAKQEKQTAADQQAYLDQYAALAQKRAEATAEHERIKAMTPEEFFEERAGLGIKKLESPVDEFGFPIVAETEKAPTLTPLEQYATTQIQAARYFATDSDKDVIDYLMKDPEQAAQLLKARLTLPGYTRKQSSEIYDSLKLAITKQKNLAEKQATAETERRRALLTGQINAVPGQEFTQNLEQQRGIFTEKDALRRMRDLNKSPAQPALPAGGYSSETGKLLTKRFPSRQAALSEEEAPPEDIPLVDELVKTLPLANGNISPGQVYTELGVDKADTGDLRTQFQIARLTGNREEASKILDALRRKPTPKDNVGIGTPQAQAAQAAAGYGRPTDARAKEIEADKFADTQRGLLLGLARQLETRRSGKLTLPATFQKKVNDAKESFIDAHAKEIDARRAAFGLPPMADWEIAEARARSLEALNTLENNWTQFENPINSVRVLQNIVRDSTYSNLLNASKRFSTETQDKLEASRKQPQKYINIEGKEIDVPRETGPRIAAPAELTLRGEPRRAKDERQDALNLIETVLQSVERRTRGAPVIAGKAPAKVGSLEDIAKLFEKEKSGGVSEKTDPATVSLLEQLRDALPTASDSDFISLAREQAQQVMEGNLPNPFAVRDLDEMMKAQKESGRSAAAPLSKEDTAAVARGEKKFQAQPQEELFPEALVQTTRATPSNFQRLLDSKNVQELKQAIEKQRADNIAALQAVSEALPTLKNRSKKIEAKYQNKLKKAQDANVDIAEFKKTLAEDLAAAEQTLIQAQAEKQKVLNHLNDIDQIKNALLNEPSDMRFLINANKALAQEPALRKKFQQASDVVENVQALVTAIKVTGGETAELLAPAQENAKKANEELDKAQTELRDIKQERQTAQLAEKSTAQTQAKKAIEKTKSDLQAYRDTLQRGREGLNLPGIRFERDTTGVRETLNELRSALGSLDSLIEETTDPVKKAEYTESRDATQRNIDSLYENAPVITTDLKTLKEIRAERELDDIQKSAYDEEEAKSRKSKGEKAPKLPPIKQTPVLKEVLGSKIKQPQPIVRTTEIANKITDQLGTKLTALAEVQRRMKFLEDNGKRKVSGRITDVYTKLDEQRKVLNARIKLLRGRQSKVIGVEKQAELTYGKAKELQKKILSKKEDQRFARGVEVESPDLTATQLQAIEDNDIGAALQDIANDKGNSEINRIVARHLSTFLEATNITIVKNLKDGKGKAVLGSATSRNVELDKDAGLSQEVLLHESAHAASERVITMPESELTRNQLIAKRELTAIFNRAKADPSITSVNAKSSLSEFLAEVMSNKNLQEQLKEKPWKMSDMWQGIKSVILRLLGVEHPETMLGGALASAEQLFIPSSMETSGVERPVSRNYSAKDISALHDGSNSMQQFSEQFPEYIKQKDRTPDDVERIALSYLSDMVSSPEKYIALPTDTSLDYKKATKMSDGKYYDNDNPLHYVEADIHTLVAMAALNDSSLRKLEASEIRNSRKLGLVSLINLLSENNTYTLAETALVAKAASKFAVIGDNNGRLKVEPIDATNRHPVAVVSLDAANSIIRELRANKPLKQAFIDGMQKNADANAKKNEGKNGWQKFNQSIALEESDLSFLYSVKELHDATKKGAQPQEEEGGTVAGYDADDFATSNEHIERLVSDGFLEERRPPNYVTAENAAVELNSACAGTKWCTGTNLDYARQHINGGDFYVYYKNGRPEVAVRMEKQNKIGEVRGNSPNQGLNDEQQQIAKEFLTNSNFTDADTYIREFETREKLIEVAKGNADITTEDLVNAKDIFDIDGEPKRTLNKLLRFNTVMGHNNIRPDLSEDVKNFFEQKYKEAAYKAYKDGRLFYSAIHAKRNSQEKHTVKFGGKSFTFTPKEIKNLDELYVNYAADFVNLETVNNLNVFSDVVYLPRATFVGDMYVFSENNATVLLQPKTYVKAISGSRDSPVEITVKGPTHIGVIKLTSSPSRSLTVHLPDTLYATVEEKTRVLARSVLIKKGEPKPPNPPPLKSVLDAPNLMGEAPPVQTLTQREERPVYARRAEAPGFEDVLGVANDVIATPKTIGQQIKANLGLAFRTQALDRLAPLEAVAQSMQDPLKGMQMMHYLRMSDQRMSFVQQAVGNGVPQRVAYKRDDGRTEYIIESVPGANLNQVVQTLTQAPNMNGEAANQLFTLYLLGKRADRVGYETLNFKVDQAKVKAAIAKIENNEALNKVFNDARKQYNAYNRDLMKFMEDSGVLSKADANKLASTDDYIPYYRERNGNAELLIGGEGIFKIGNLKDQPQLRELIGGEDKILDFTTSSVQNTSMLLDAGLRNLAARNAMFELTDMGLATFMGGEARGPDVVMFRQDGGEKYVKVHTDSTGIPADLLVKGMEGIPVSTNAFVKTMGFFATGVRKGVMLNPMYPVKQLLRDSVAAPLLSGANFTPVMGAIRQLGESATKQKLQARGITGGQVFTGTNKDLARILKDMQEGRMGLGQFIAKAEAIAMEADASTRRAQYDSYIEQGLSQMEATTMALESMNFNRRGLSPTAHFLSTTIPFFNAQVQSLDVLWRSMRGKMPMNDRLDIQGKLLRRGSLLAATAVAYAMMMQDDEAYKNANPEEKYGNIFIRIPGLKEPFRFPVPFEIGYIFKGIPEALVNIMANENGAQEAYKAFKAIVIQTVPGGTSLFLPAGLKPIIESAANYSFFSGRTLETKQEQSLLPEFRFRDNTSEIAKQIGSIIGVSPIKIENLVRGYTGTMGVAFTQAVSMAMPTGGSPEQATKRLSDTPIIGSMFQPNDAGGIVNATYDRMEHLIQVKKSYDDMIKDGRIAEARGFMQENMQEIIGGMVSGNAKAQLTKVTQAMNAIKASGMTPDKKREMLDKMQALRIKIAESIRGMLDKTTPPSFYEK